MILLSRSSTSCARLVQAYEYQLDILALQDQLSVAQKAISQLASEVEHDRYAKDAIGTRTLSPGESAQYGVQQVSVVV